jgi:hypothetical protein
LPPEIDDERVLPHKHLEWIAGRASVSIDPLTTGSKTMNRMPATAAALALLCSFSLGAFAHDRDDDDRDRRHRHHGDNDFRIEVLSGRPDMVAGGDALVRVSVKKHVRLSDVRVELNGANVTGAFVANHGARTLTGLVSGMRLGRNELEVDAKRKGHGRSDAELKLTNHSIQGPIISGPHEFPFACRTESFVPFPGSPALGAPLDSDCSIERRVQYVYRTTGGAFAALPEPHSTLPADLAMTTTVTGATVPYIVRLETGTINRAIYQTAILHNPNDAAPSPFASPAGWNRRLIYPLGGGCQGGWFTQGLSRENPLNNSWLSQGYAVASATLNTFGNNCNDLLSSETIIMVKERFIESYGVPLFTIGTGSSGGAYQSNQTADNYPGTFDGIVTTNSFPDVTTGMIVLGDARLLDIYFNVTRPGQYTADQQRAISGFLQVNNIAFLSGRTINSGSARRMDPRVAFPAEILPGVGPEFRYDPVTNPYGARGSVYDHTVNVYGQVRNTPFHGDARFAQRPLDNVGVQYGLKALNDGAISVEQFLDLNAAIGGFDIDLNHIPSRTTAYPGATRRAYQGGRILGAGNGHKVIPIITRKGNGDAVVNGDIHLRFWANSIRERLIKANGHANNQVVVGSQAPTELLIEQMGRWLAAIAADQSNLPKDKKVVKNKPADVVDACWSDGVKIVEPQTAFGDSQCNTLFPVGISAAMVAGAPLAHDIIKCKLKPIDKRDYAVSLSGEQRTRLHAIFPDGVCDWSRRGVEQTKSVPWASFGPSPVNLLFDVLNPSDRHGRDDDDDDDD